MSITATNRLELLQIADAVSREKGIDKGIVIEAMEEAMEKAARTRYGQESNIKVRIDRKTGAISILRLMEVVENVEDYNTQITLEDAQHKNAEAKIGDFISDQLPPIDFGRVAALGARQVIIGKVREAERERQYEEFKDRVGEVINGIVKRVEYGNVIMDVGRGEAVIRKEHLIPREAYRYGDNIRAYLFDIKKDMRGPQLYLSRTHPGFMARLFMQEVPEIYEGIIEIKAVARDPGSRAKIAVFTNDPSIDPVGACVGMRGSRVQAVVNELQGERVDIIPWSEDVATFLVNALQPAEVTKVVLDEDTQRMEVVIADDQLSLAIGRRGQNVRLASELTGWEIDILTEEQESERRQKEFNERTSLFMEGLNVDETVAQLLTTEGFTAIDEIAHIELVELASIEGFDMDTAEELHARAENYLAEYEESLDQKIRDLGVDQELVGFEGLTKEMTVALGENDVKTIENLAECATDDLIGWSESKNGERTFIQGFLTSHDLTRDEAEYLIMQARLHEGWITEEDIVQDIEPESDASEAIQAKKEINILASQVDA